MLTRFDEYLIHQTSEPLARAAQVLLQGQGIEPQQVHYLQHPPGAAELGQLLASLKVPASAIVRFNEPIARELGLAPTDLRTDAEWLALIAANPVLLERPIVVHEGRACVGRPPEAVLDLPG